MPQGAPFGLRSGPSDGRAARIAPPSSWERPSEAEVFDIGYDDISLGDLAPDGAQFRPHIVWFGEAVPKIEQAIDAVSRADILLIVGTSLQVYPAAGLYRYAGYDTPIYIIDPKDVPVNDRRIVHIREVATKGMEIFKNILKSE